MIKKEPELWVRAARQNNRKIFSELNVLLRALDRFFYPENLPTLKEILINKSFFNEMRAVRDVTLRTLSLIEAVLPESRKNAYWFQKFAEAKYLSDRKRDYYKEELYRQDTEEKSMYLLYDSFINLKGIATDLLKNDFIPFMSYSNLGDLISKQIRDNVYFNPFKKDIDPEFDVIEHREISEIVKGIKDKSSKKIISVVFLHLFKFLRYLSHVDIATQRYVALNCSLMILMLLKSEIGIFRIYSERASGRLKDETLGGLLQSLSFQFAMETRRVYLQELKDVLNKAAPQQMRGSIENSHGILKNLTEQTIIQLAQFWKPELKGEEIFGAYTTRLEQSLKLREDIIVFHRLLTVFEKKSDSEEDRHGMFSVLLSFMSYFESFTFRLLRYNDYEEFSSFFGKISRFGREDLTGGEFIKVLDVCGHFKIFLETNLRQIANRSELKERPADMEKVEDIVRQYLSKDQKGASWERF